MHALVMPLMLSLAPCRGAGLSGTCLLFTSYFQFNNPQIEYCPIFQNFKHAPTTTNS